MSQVQSLPEVAAVFRFLVGLLVLLALAFLATRLTEGRQLVEVLARGVPLWIIAAITFEVVLRLNQAGFLQAVFHLFGVPLGFIRAAQLLLVNQFTSVAAPGGSLSGAAVVVAACVRQGVEPARAMIVSFVYFLMDYAAFSLVLAAAVTYLAQAQLLYPYEIWATVLLAVLVACMAALLGVALFFPDYLQRLGRLLEGRLARALLLRQVTYKSPITTWITELISTVRRLRTHRQGLVRPIVFALAVQVLGVLTLASIFLAFQYPVSAAVLIAGYAVGKLFTIISITPSGIGFVEGAMTGAFVSLGVPLEAAVVVVLVYRGINVWLPFLVGIWGMRTVAGR